MRFEVQKYEIVLEAATFMSWKIRTFAAAMDKKNANSIRIKNKRATFEYFLVETTNAVNGFNEDYPGIYVPAGSTLTIKGETSGTGVLFASSNDDGNNAGAGIGGGWNLACGNIVIQSGVIDATGSTNAAGIGSNNMACGNITISGGTVTATGGKKAAGIGGGFGGGCGDITIASTVTRVTAIKGLDALHSIGRGRTGPIGTVTIGGVVTGAISTSPYIYPVPGTIN